MVGAAAATEHGQLRQALADRDVLVGELLRVTLVELAAGPDDAGAGLLLTGNGLRVLDGFGLGTQVRAAGRRVEAVRFAEASGAELFRLPIPAAWPGFVSLHRARLRRALLEAARDANTESGEAATGYRWGEPRLRRHVQRILEAERSLPEEEQDRRLVRVARRFLGDH